MFLIFVKDFPLKFEVFPSKNMFMTCDHHLNGMQTGGLCKFRVHLNEKETRSSLDVRVTSNFQISVQRRNTYVNLILLSLDIDMGSSQQISFLLNQKYEKVQHVFGALCKFLKLSMIRIKNRHIKIDFGLI